MKYELKNRNKRNEINQKKRLTTVLVVQELTTVLVVL